MKKCKKCNNQQNVHHFSIEFSLLGDYNIDDNIA